MKWVLIPLLVIVALVVIVAAIGAMLPRDHKASRTLTIGRTATVIWPVLLRATQTSSVPVDVLEQQAPHRLVTRVTQKEKKFGGTWTIEVRDNGVMISEDGWVANPIFRFVSRFMMGHHASMDGLLAKVATQLGEPVRLSGE